MIRIKRTAEPSSLAPVRLAGLAAARAALNTGSSLKIDGYPVVKPELASMQNRKCCYCEKREEQEKYRDVEHYRPKSRYWWLAWTWDNLLFACIDCNRECKRSLFPLEAGCAVLSPEVAAPGSERALVLDPSDPQVDPSIEIQFRPEMIQGREHWAPHGLTPRGRETVKVCGLDRPNLRDLYAEHVKHKVRPRLEGVLDAMRSGDARAVVATWSRCTRALLNPNVEFNALSHDALDHLVRPAVRAKYQLVLVRP